MTQPMSWTDKELSIGQLAARSGAAVTALRFYETEGLIFSKRTPGNQRRYRRDTLRRIALIRVAQRVGIPLAEIARALAELPDQRTPTAHDWACLADRWRAELDDRITALLQLRDQFSDCIGCGCLSLQSCVLANPGDELGTRGPGPQRLTTNGTALTAATSSSTP